MPILANLPCFQFAYLLLLKNARAFSPISRKPLRRLVACHGVSPLPAQETPAPGPPPAEAPRLSRDPVAAAEAAAAAPSEEFLARARERAANRPAIRYLRFSAIVYPHGDGSAPTLVRWRHDGQGYQAWSSIDWNHFRSLDQFESYEGKTRYWSMMAIGDATRWREKPGSIVPPTFQAGEVSYQIIEGDPANKDALADLEVLHNLYRTDGHRLKLAHEIREKANRERQAWLEANPPKPRDIIFRHWEVHPAGNK